MDTHFVTEALVQYGFAGLAAVLLFLLYWLIKRIFDVLAECAEVIANNTSALAALEGRIDDEARLHRDIRDRLLGRPCLMDRTFKDTASKGTTR
jgi:hypothetical protein